MKIQIPNKWKRKLRLWLRLIFHWRFLVCFGIGWLITNGWSYLLLGLGLLTKTAWMTAVAGAYLAFLWLPISPEKIVTVAIALFLARHLFPKYNQKLEQEILEASDSSTTKSPKNPPKKPQE